MRKRLWAVAAAAASIGMAVPASAASYVAEASATLTGLTYRLIDLDPADGITPWARFDTGTTVLVGYARGDGLESASSILSGTPFTATSGSVRSLDGGTEAQAGAGQMAVRTSLSAESFVVGEALPIRRATAEYPNIFDDQGEIVGNWFALELSPHTAIVIEGEATASAIVDTRLLSGTTFMNSLIEQQQILDVSAYVYAGIGLTGSYDGDVPETFSSAYSRYDGANVFAGVLEDGSFITEPYLESMTRSIAVGHFNGSDEVATLSMDIFVRSDVASYQYMPWTPPPVDPGTPPAVPEASTQALMLLGLGGLALVARRRRS